MINERRHLSKCRLELIIGFRSSHVACYLVGWRYAFAGRRHQMSKHSSLQHTTEPARQSLRFTTRMNDDQLQIAIRNSVGDKSHLHTVKTRGTSSSSRSSDGRSIHLLWQLSVITAAKASESKKQEQWRRIVCLLIQQTIMWLQQERKKRNITDRHTNKLLVHGVSSWRNAKCLTSHDLQYL